MDPANTVISNPVVSLVGFLMVIGLLLFLIAKWKWHVFLALLIPIILFGIIPGVQKNNFIQAFETGFGKTLGKIGVVIVLGSIIAEALKHTGAIQVITRSMVRLVGARRMPLALTLTGFILGIAIVDEVDHPVRHVDACILHRHSLLQDCPPNCEQTLNTLPFPQLPFSISDQTIALLVDPVLSVE